MKLVNCVDEEARPSEKAAYTHTSTFCEVLYNEVVTFWKAWRAMIACGCKAFVIYFYHHHSSYISIVYLLICLPTNQHNCPPCLLIYRLIILSY